MHLSEIISRFQNAKLIGENSYQVRCNCHDDKKASLTITEEDNKILMHCHAGCDVRNILAAAGLTEKDLFNEVQKKPEVVAEYLYKDAEENTLYKVIRFEPKNFVQAKYDNGNWIFKMTGVNYVLYNLPNVVKSDVVYFVEGEKDADNLNKIGLVATTSAGGAAGFKKKAEQYVKDLKDKTVYIIPDNDKPGFKYADDVKEALNGVAKEVKILKLANVVEDLKEKSDISDVIQKFGKEKTLELLDKLINDEINAIDTELTEENVKSIENFEKLYKLETENDIVNFLNLKNKLKEFCKSKRITGFDKDYNLYKSSKLDKSIYNLKSIVFPDLNDKTYDTNKYEMSPDGVIYEIIPDKGKILVCYHPIIPIEKYKNLEDGTEKIKLAYYVDEEWNYIIVDKSTISSNQSIVKLSDRGIMVTSENAKFLVKYLAEMQNLNASKIPKSISISRLGWFGNILAPYSDKYEFDNEVDLPNIKEKFKESGKLEDWVEFFRDKRKYNNISRIAMAAGVASILLKDLKQSGFTVHFYGASEVGKSVACMAAQSIFGNPAQNDNKGIGINFNFTAVGLEYRLNLYNNIPLFINEMQHQKDAKDYDKILFLISEGKGKARSTKVGGIGKENSWNNVVITNGEKNIIKDNSNAGAYNRCIACEVKDYSYENLSEVADFSKENYGTAIREILRKLNDYDLNNIYKESLEKIKNQEITNKQKILEAILLTADKILVDIIFKDEYYLQPEDFEDKTVNKNDVRIEERAYLVIQDWFVTEKRHFLMQDQEKIDNTDIKVDVYGREMSNGYVAIVPTILKKVLEDNGYDCNEVLKAWNKKDYIKHDKGKNTSTVRLNGGKARCIVLDINRDLDESEEEIMPF
jgi:hypothetical protein